MDKLLPLDLPPGMRNTGTVYESKGRWYTGNFVRFFNGTKQPIGGWAARSLTGVTITGVPRAAITYKDSAGVQLLVIGTTAGVFVVKAGVVTDISFAGIGTVANRVWQFDVFGEYLVAVDYRAPDTGGVIYYWTGNTATDLVAIDNGDWTGSFRTSQSARSVVATPERFLVQLGGVETDAP